MSVLGVQGRCSCPYRGQVGTRTVGSTQRWTAYFADQRANVYAVDAISGELVWKRLVDSFLGATITSSPTLAGDALYVGTSSAEEVLGANAKYECCKFRGSVSAIDAATTGEVRWRSFTIAEEAKPVRKNKQGVQLERSRDERVCSTKAPPMTIVNRIVNVGREPLQQPRLCHHPVPLHGRRRDVERVRRFRNAQAGKEPQLHDAAGALIEGSQFCQRFVQGEHLDDLVLHGCVYTVQA